MRVFIGVEVVEIEDELISWQDRLRVIDRSARFTKPENLHLTLEFIGEVTEEDLKALKEIVEGFKFEPFAVEFDKIVKWNNNVVLLERRTKPLMEIQRELRKIIKKRRFVITNKPYIPHVTLSRKSNIINDYDVFYKMTVKEIILYSSTLYKEGPVYKELTRSIR